MITRKVNGKAIRLWPALWLSLACSVISTAGTGAYLYNQHSRFVNFTIDESKWVKSEGRYPKLGVIEVIDTGQAYVGDLDEPVACIGLADCALLYLKDSEKHGAYHIRRDASGRQIKEWIKQNFPEEKGIEAIIVQGSLNQRRNQSRKYFTDLSAVKKAYLALKSLDLHKNAKYAPLYVDSDENREISLILGKDRLFMGRNVIFSEGKLMSFPENFTVEGL